MRWWLQGKAHSRISFWSDFTEN